MLITLKYLYGILLFSLDLSLQLINMVITAAGVLRSLLNMAAPLTPGGWGGGAIDFHAAAMVPC